MKKPQPKKKKPQPATLAVQPDWNLGQRVRITLTGAPMPRFLQDMIVKGKE